MSFEAIALIITALLGFGGYFITYWHNLRLMRRTERLQLISRQISEFYGPLFVLTQTGERSYKALLYKLGGEKRRSVFRDPTFEVSEEDIAEWRIWVREVFMPNNLAIEKLIVEKAYLLREEKVPECLLDFITHVSGYKAVLAKWAEGDFSENLSIVDFPKELREYTQRSYSELKKEQLQLINGQ